MNLTSLAWGKFPFGEHAKRALSWWWGELKEFVPERLRPSQGGAGAQLLLEARRDGLLCYAVRAGDRQPLGRFPSTDADLTETRAFLGRIRRSLLDSTAVRLVLPQSRVLRRRVRLPAAARENIREVLAYEMDRQTPFRADQVYYAYHVVDHPLAGDELAVELIAAPSAEVDALLDLIASFDIPVDSIEVALNHGVTFADQHGTINLLPQDKRSGRRRELDQRNVLLMMSLLSLLVVVAILPIVKIGRVEHELAAQLAALEPRAEQVLELRERLQSHLDATATLLRLKQSSPAVVAVLAELAETLPDDTWLDNLELSAGALRIRGESGSSSRLIELIEASPSFRSVSFASPVTQDPKTGKEQFEIRAELEARD